MNLSKPSTFNIPVKIIKGEYEVRINTDKIEPCKGKEIRVWSWKRMKKVVWIIHINEKGEVTTKEKIE